MAASESRRRPSSTPSASSKAPNQSLRASRGAARAANALPCQRAPWRNFLALLVCRIAEPIAYVLPFVFVNQSQSLYKLRALLCFEFLMYRPQ